MFKIEKHEIGNKTDVKLNLKKITESLEAYRNQLKDDAQTSDRLELYLKLLNLSSRINLLLNMNHIIVQNPMFFDKVRLGEMKDAYNSLRQASLQILDMILLYNTKSSEATIEELDKSIDLSILSPNYIA